MSILKSKIIILNALCAQLMFFGAFAVGSDSLDLASCQPVDHETIEVFQTVDDLGDQNLSEHSANKPERRRLLPLWCKLISFAPQPSIMDIPVQESLKDVPIVVFGYLSKDNQEFVFDALMHPNHARTLCQTSASKTIGHEDFQTWQGSIYPYFLTHDESGRKIEALAQFNSHVFEPVELTLAPTLNQPDKRQKQRKRKRLAYLVKTSCGILVAIGLIIFPPGPSDMLRLDNFIKAMAASGAILHAIDSFPSTTQVSQVLDEEQKVDNLEVSSALHYAKLFCWFSANVRDCWKDFK